jgi:hypothetical protein
MRKRAVAAATLISGLAVGAPASADVVAFQFGGEGVSGSLAFTIAPNVSPPDPNPACVIAGNNPCRADPTGAYMITGVTGTFSDTNNSFVNNQPLSIVSAQITGLIPISPANERDTTFDPLVPTSLSFIDYAKEATPGSALSYNNLAFPDGSPIDCAFPFTGTFLDVFGVAFTIAGGDTVVVWGDGDYLGGPLTYGVGITDGTNELDYQFSGVSASVPEPASVGLLGAGLLGLLAWRRKSHAALTWVE